MNIADRNGFGLGKLEGLTWSSVCNYYAETERDDGDTTYRGQYICTGWNDEDGGDLIDANGRSIDDDDVEALCQAIDRELGE